MPTYEFRCANGHDFEQFHRKISDAPSSVPCPTCGAVAERRISGGAGLQFKGSGFYLTDYGKNAHRAGGKPEGKKAEGGEGAKGEGGKGEGGAKGDGAGAPSGSDAAGGKAPPAAPSGGAAPAKGES